jgi:ribonuclease HI
MTRRKKRMRCPNASPNPRLRIYVDGASRGNPGESAVGMVAVDGEGREIIRSGKRIGRETNNSAEYRAVLEALEYLERREREEGAPIRATIYSDSELLIRQLEGRYKVRSGHLGGLYLRVMDTLRAKPHIGIAHVKREENKIADWIVNRVLDGKPYRPADRSREVTRTSEESPGS